MGGALAELCGGGWGMAKGKVLARMTDAKVSDPLSRVLGVFVVLCDSWLPEFRQSARGAGPTGG